MLIVNGMPIHGDPIDWDAEKQMEICMNPDMGDAVHGALMADHHLGYSMPIGGVIGYRNMVSPSGVGYDIACGNKAVQLDVKYEDIREDVSDFMDEIWNSIDFGVGRKNSNKKAPNFTSTAAVSQHPAWDIPHVASLSDIAHQQLGTIGSGNHFVDLFFDKKGYVWIGVHFGSRGFGHKIATEYIKLAYLEQFGTAKVSGGFFAEPALLDMDTDLGREYLKAMELAGLYAYMGRDWVCDTVADIIGGKITGEVHNHHNFTWLEEHYGEMIYVVRKGATPAFPGQHGFVGGSMGDNSVIIKGKESEGGAANMFSTVHGAGRVMSRSQAKKEISDDMVTDWLDDRPVRIELRGAGVDESPYAYKRLTDVLAHQGDSIEIIEELTPIGVAMAGKNEFDPYKD
jgi:tRNA-splicing ligase RtcB